VAAGRTPSARESAGLAYDDAAGRTFLFGGNANGKLQDDTWVLAPR
jgi:hypothetical protein